MKRGILLVAAIAVGVPSIAVAQEPDAGALRRRSQIQMMEGVLTRAVRSGAEDLARRMQRRDPGLMLFTGQARARGFILEGYGVFFDVEIPALRPTVVWAAQTLQRDVTIANALESLAQSVAAMPDGAARVRAEQALKHVQQLNPAPPPRANMPAAGSVQATAADAAAADPMSDPHASYTEAVKSALIDAMLDYSLPMDLGADEWLTVAARDSEGPLTPDEIYDATTIVLRVKGSDLAIYAADRSRRSEVRGRVEVRQF